MSTEPRIIAVGCEPPPLEPAPGTVRPGAEPKPKRHRKASADGGRFGALNRFVDLTLRRIDPTAAAVWLVLYRDTKPDGLARTGQGDIARRIGRCVRTVYAALRRLEDLELLIIVRRGRLNAGATVYRVRPLARGDL